MQSCFFYKFTTDWFSLADVYFDRLTFRSTLRRLRSGLKITLAHLLAGVLDASVCSRKLSELVILYSLLVSFALFAVYVYTFRLRKPSQCNNLAVIALVVNVIVCVLLFANGTILPDDAFLIGSMQLISISLILPLPVDINLVVLILYASFFAIFRSMPTSIVEGQTQLILETGLDQSGQTDWLTITLWFTVILDGLYLTLWRTARHRLILLYLAERVHYSLWIKRQIITRHGIWKHMVPRSLLSLTAPTGSSLAPVADGDEPVAITPASVGPVRARRCDHASVWFGQLIGLDSILGEHSLEEKSKLLHSVVSVLDQCCLQSGCEKVCTLGSCYVSVAGCPHEVPDHAVRCVNFGLMACHGIKYLGHEWRRPIRLRVAVHTTAVIYTLQRKHTPLFEIYTHELNFMKEILENCMDGRICVSGETYSLISERFRFARGPTIGMSRFGRLDRDERATYVVDPRSGDAIPWVSTKAEFQEMCHKQVHHLDTKITRIIATCATGVSTCAKDLVGHYRLLHPTLFRHSPQQAETDEWMRRHNGLKFSLQYFVGNFQHAPEELGDTFGQLPINYWTMKFTDATVEHQYRHQAKGEFASELMTESQIIALGTDVLCVLLHNILVIVTTYSIVYFRLPNGVGFAVFCASETSVYLGVSAVFVWIMTNPLPENEEHGNRWVRLAHRLCTNSLFCEFVFAFFCLMPTLHLIIVVFGFVPYPTNSEISRNLLDTLSIVVCITHVLGTGSRYVARLLATFGSVLIVTCLQYMTHTVECQCTDPTCGQTEHYGLFLVQMGIVTVVIWITVRDHDYTYRMVFYERMKKHKKEELTKKACNVTKTFAHNIIPTEMWNQIVTELCMGKTQIELSQCWKETSQVAVACVHVSSFYHTDVSDDDVLVSQVELMQKLFAMFYQLLSSDTFEQVYALKYFGNYCQFVSGLWSDTFTESHPVSLMEFCFMLIRQTERFNEEYFPYQKAGFEITIGYHMGTVTGGLAGKSRLAYELWGEPVDVAYNLMWKPLANQVLVSEKVREIFNLKYHFKKQETLTVSPESNAPVYVCMRKEAL
ncbi:unnamed protein product [Dicrocoelium dendriticum]|nr:unnamed protein product [Dicrocoelium dendriticum]